AAGVGVDPRDPGPDDLLDHPGSLRLGDRLGLEHPDRAVGALDRPALAGLERDPQDAHLLTVQLGQRSLHVAAGAAEPPGTHLPLDLRGGPAPVDPGVLRLEERPVLVRLALRIARIAAL